MREKMLTGAPIKTLLLFSLPILAGNLLQQLYSVIDAVIVGHFVSSNALGAIGCTMPIVFMGDLRLLRPFHRVLHPDRSDYRS